MFDQSLTFQLVQIQTNKFLDESFTSEFIYKFYRHTDRCCIKYIVCIKEYQNELLTPYYYPKINLTPKFQSGESICDLRYKIMTKQNSFGRIGGIILDVMQDVQHLTGHSTWGFLAANLLTEISNVNNKRYQVYKEVLARTFIVNHSVFGNKENSAIFVIPNIKVPETERIIEDYEYIFSETN